MKTRRGGFVVAAAALALGAGRATREADRLVLKSGRELVGELVTQRDHKVLFRDEKRGELELLRRDVRTVVRGEETPGLFAPLVLDAAIDEAPATYIRFVAPDGDKAGSLSTGVARFFDERTRTTLFLVGAVHIADSDYYARVQDVLDSCDVVLFEGVGGSQPHGPPSTDELERIDALTKLQLMVKDALGLQFQKDGLDYRRAFWRNADVDLTSLTKKLDAEGVGLPTDSPLFRALLKFVVGAFDLSAAGKDPELQRLLKRQVAGALAQSDKLVDFGGGKLNEVLVGWRDDAALKVLDDELAHGAQGRWLAIFYGAAHLPDLAKKLGERGFEYQRSGWLDAWNVE
jgi:hypothetical protein